MPKKVVFIKGMLETASSDVGRTPSLIQSKF